MWMWTHWNKIGKWIWREFRLIVTKMKPKSKPLWVHIFFFLSFSRHCSTIGMTQNIVKFTMQFHVSTDTLEKKNQNEYVMFIRNLNTYTHSNSVCRTLLGWFLKNECDIGIGHNVNIFQHKQNIFCSNNSQQNDRINCYAAKFTISISYSIHPFHFHSHFHFELKTGNDLRMNYVRFPWKWGNKKSMTKGQWTQLKINYNFFFEKINFRLEQKKRDFFQNLTTKIYFFFLFIFLADWRHTKTPIDTIATAAHHTESFTWKTGSTRKRCHTKHRYRTTAKTTG